MRRGLGVVVWSTLALACSRAPRPAPPEPASPVVATASLPPPPHVTPTPPPEPAPCDAGDVLIFASPEHPVRGAPLRVVAVFDRPIDAELALADATHARVVSTHDRQGGPPYFLFAEIDAAASGTYEATLAPDPRCIGTAQSKTIRVAARAPAPRGVAEKGLWRTRAAWKGSTENLYGAWVAKLVDAPLDTQPSWTALHDVLRDAKRNFLFNYLGASEDEQEVAVRPDCADLPYFLRAYFAFKLGLPFAWSTCTRGDKGQAPTCKDWTTNEDETPSAARVRDKTARADAASSNGKPKRDPAFAAFAEFLQGALADAAQSGAGRTAADDEDSDYYPVALSPDTLRPGTIFADPYGHVLVVAKRIPQTESAGGILLAIDGQPDGTVARKRFWRGNFLFAADPALGGPGFKRFRPVVRDSRTGKLRRLTNHELSSFSLEQSQGGVEGFYDRMEDVLSPAPIDPMRALLETMQALDEQVRTRALSVDNGRKFLDTGRVAEMPDGAKLFETTGDWEDFSTPSRDLRLLIAIDVVHAFPARVERRPERYAMPQGKSVTSVKGELETALARELGSRRVTYTRSDGSPWELSLEDVTHRAADLEMAYNPNDCVETRWGAPPGSPEASTCTKHAPAAQLAKMDQVRSWFHERRRPARD